MRYCAYSTHLAHSDQWKRHREYGVCLVNTKARAMEKKSAWRINQCIRVKGTEACNLMMMMMMTATVKIGIKKRKLQLLRIVLWLVKFRLKEKSRNRLCGCIHTRFGQMHRKRSHLRQVLLNNDEKSEILHLNRHDQFAEKLSWCN